VELCRCGLKQSTSFIHCSTHLPRSSYNCSFDLNVALCEFRLPEHYLSAYYYLRSPRRTAVPPDGATVGSNFSHENTAGNLSETDVPKGSDSI